MVVIVDGSDDDDDDDDDDDVYNTIIKRITNRTFTKLIYGGLGI